MKPNETKVSKYLKKNMQYIKCRIKLNIFIRIFLPILSIVKYELCHNCYSMIDMKMFKLTNLDLVIIFSMLVYAL